MGSEKSGFRYVKLKEIASLSTGSTPSRKDKECYAVHGLPWAKIENLDQGEIYETSEYLSNEGVRRVRVVPRGSVLVSVIGTIGKVGIAGTDMSVNQQILSAVFLPDADVFPKYVYYYLKYSSPKIQSMAYATVEKRLSTGRMGEFVLPLPKRGVQEHIASLLERVEQYREIQKKKREKLGGLCTSLEEYSLTDWRYREALGRAKSLEKLTEKSFTRSEQLLDSFLHHIFDAWEKDKNVRYLNQESLSPAVGESLPVDVFLQSLEDILNQLSEFQRSLFLTFYESGEMMPVHTAFQKMTRISGFEKYQMQDAVGSADILRKLGLLQRQEGKILKNPAGEELTDESGQPLGIALWSSLKEGTSDA